ncbi:unnamed protein product, partial [Heterotrigona itama]
MDAIKKKMQGMKLEKDNAMDRALLCEQQARDANARAEKAEEEARALQKKIQTIENELDQTQEALMQVNAKLEEKDKALQNVTLTSTTRRRGHQHHPRHATRRRLDTSSRGPAQCGPADIVKGTPIGSNETPTTTTSSRLDEKSNVIGTVRSTAVTVPTIVGARWLRDHPTVTANAKDASSNENSEKIKKTKLEDDEREKNVRHRLAQCSLDVLGDQREQFVRDNRHENQVFDSYETEHASTERSRTKPRGNKSDDETKSKENSPEPEHAVARARGDGNSDDESTNVEEDPELAELAKLRCPSERTEVQAEREARRRKRCADYPGLAFGWSIFSSDTMMKFGLIRNELQNIMGNQLKRVMQGTLLDVLKKKMRQTKEEMEKYKDECEEYQKRLQVEVIRREEAESEVAALNRRIQLLEEDLERSEERLATATAKLAEASQAADESER